MYILVSKSSISKLVAISVAVFKGRFPVLAVVLQNNKGGNEEVDSDYDFVSVGVCFGTENCR